MYWQEKIDLIQKKYPASDFKDPFRSGKEVVEKIITKLFNTSRQKFLATNDRSALLKDGKLLRTCTVRQLYQVELARLEKDKHFWLMLMNLPMGADIGVYDCKSEPLRELLYLSSGSNEQDFCIVDKKYSWLLYFKLDREKDIAEIWTAESGLQKGPGWE